MIVYAEREEQVSSRAFQARIKAASDPVERLILNGQYEAAVLDALCPKGDDLIDLTQIEAPAALRIRPAEGFAWYALYPEQYRAAAERFMREVRPSSCVVIGVRSIGTSLSRVVADALACPVLRFSVRPHGHPFDRRVTFGAQLADRIRQHAADWFLIVDEGPGLSGSSMASVADALTSLGVPEDRIVFFPAHSPDIATLRSERARAMAKTSHLCGDV